MEPVRVALQRPSVKRQSSKGSSTLLYLAQDEKDQVLHSRNEAGDDNTFTDYQQSSHGCFRQY